MVDKGREQKEKNIRQVGKIWLGKLLGKKANTYWHPLTAQMVGSQF